MSPLFHVVLHEPEIPNNTGNIGRTCVATRCALHLIHPLGFELSDKACRRAGLDYWPRLDVHEHADWDAYLRDAGPDRIWLFTTRTDRCVFDADLSLGDHLVFGKETAGLPDALLSRYPERCLGFPMERGERSMNVATVVSAAVYEGIRQLYVRNMIGFDRSLRLC
ncbi:MAG: tRNA (cytidine(34)-2'-O)-methyltransferase [Planctomycetota bacterium]|nr:MAG: tRNA (cytidine(34)-2'-O)-methyltransferase [Planctomycetota bacterium]